MQEKRKNKKIITLLLITGAVYFFLAYLTPLLAPVLLAMLFVVELQLSVIQLQLSSIITNKLYKKY